MLSIHGCSWNCGVECEGELTLSEDDEYSGERSSDRTSEPGSE